MMGEKTNNLYIITGPAGVGKSTISYQIAKKKMKSVLIEGDNIYSQVVGGYVSAWKEGNHLNIFWKICLDNIETYLKDGYDVVFNYIVTPKIFEIIKEKFKKYNVKFIILMCDEKTILKRDNERSENYKMKERCITLLNNFKEYKFKEKYYLDTTDITIENVVKTIENNTRFLIYREDDEKNDK